MFTSLLKIQSDHTLEHHNIRLTLSLAEKWKAKKGDTFTIFFGLMSVIVNITSIGDKENAISASPSLLSYLKLSNVQQIRYHYVSSQKKLFLGPIIAIITEIQQQKPVTFGSISDFCEEVTLLSEKSSCFFYVTSLSLWDKETIYGYSLQDSEWRKEEMPFPSIVYNRIHSRAIEQSNLFQEWVELLQEYEIPHFNDRFLNKWEVYQKLLSYPHMKPFLPTSYLFTSRSVLEQSLREFPCVFVKPIYGSQGKHIFKIKSEPHKLLVDYTTFQREISKEYSSLPELFATLKENIGKRPYIVQQGLPLYTYDERPVDFRMLCQKSNGYTWNVTSAVARVSSGDFVSNIAMGGSILKIDEVLLSGFEASEVKHMKKLLIELSIETAKCLSQAYEGVYAEFGMDVALDQQGNPWLLEVNVKPSKNMVSSTSIPRPSARALLHYCIACAKQPLRRNDSC
ncbi:YheC/YheD family protein [Ectobacillus polymachus]|uniref:YheC/YheD family endospore coat-associated protein n=1 Tax=Ectobacillus polymachus TaxID=1508806 RepID=UPI003A8C5B92